MLAATPVKVSGPYVVSTSPRSESAALPENGRSMKSGASSAGRHTALNRGESASSIHSSAPDALSACIAASIPAMYGNILISIGSASAAPSVNAEYMSTRFISAYIISPSIIRGRI